MNRGRWELYARQVEIGIRSRRDGPPRSAHGISSERTKSTPREAAATDSAEPCPQSQRYPPSAEALWRQEKAHASEATVMPVYEIGHTTIGTNSARFVRIAVRKAG